MPPKKNNREPGNLLDEAAVERIFQTLAKTMPGREPGAKGSKEQPDLFRSCVSCMLSAQSRDENTAKASRQLFELADTPEGILGLDDASIVQAIRPAGLYNMKCKNVKAFCRTVIGEHAGDIPTDRKGLMSLPGIGRKCADIVLSFALGEAVIAVDSHVHRVVNRLGLAQGKTEAQSAISLDQRAPQWAKADGHFWLIQLGKRICASRAPKCDQCPVSGDCRWYDQISK